MKYEIEKQPCSRCGGSGRMPYAVYGGKCFKCHGAGKTYTRNGKAVANKFAALRHERPYAVPACELQAGDIIWVGSITLGGDPFETTARVDSVDPTLRQTGMHSSNGGPMVPTMHMEYVATIRWKNSPHETIHFNTSRETIVKKKLSNADKIAIYQQIGPRKGLIITEEEVTA